MKVNVTFKESARYQDCVIDVLSIPRKKENIVIANTCFPVEDVYHYSGSNEIVALIKVGYSCPINKSDDEFDLLLNHGIYKDKNGNRRYIDD